MRTRADFHKKGRSRMTPRGLRAAGRSVHPATVSAAKPSTAAGDDNSQQERDQQRTKRRFARDITQDAQWHPGLSTHSYRTANSIDRPFHGIGDFRDGGFRFWNGIQAVVGKRGQRAVITHDLISKPTNSQSIKT
jgi:hypothetical protein